MRPMRWRECTSCSQYVYVYIVCRKEVFPFKVIVGHFMFRNMLPQTHKKLINFQFLAYQVDDNHFLRPILLSIEYGLGFSLHTKSQWANMFFWWDKKKAAQDLDSEKNYCLYRQWASVQQEKNRFNLTCKWYRGFFYLTFPSFFPSCRWFSNFEVMCSVCQKPQLVRCLCTFSLCQYLFFLKNIFNLTALLLVKIHCDQV